MSVDILGTNCDQCRSMVQCCFTSTETVWLIRMESPGGPPQLSHSSWTLEFEWSTFKDEILPLSVGKVLVMWCDAAVLAGSGVTAAAASWQQAQSGTAQPIWGLWLQLQSLRTVHQKVTVLVRFRLKDTQSARTLFVSFPLEYPALKGNSACALNVDRHTAHMHSVC